MIFLFPSVVTASSFASHTHPIAAATTDADVLGSVGAPANVTADDVGALALDVHVLREPGALLTNNCGAALCDANSLNGGTIAKAAQVVTDVPVTARADLIQASGAAKRTVVTAIPTVTGAPA